VQQRERERERERRTELLRNLAGSVISIAINVKRSDDRFNSRKPADWLEVFSDQCEPQYSSKCHLNGRNTR